MNRFTLFLFERLPFFAVELFVQVLANFYSSLSCFTAAHFLALAIQTLLALLQAFLPLITSSVYRYLGFHPLIVMQFAALQAIINIFISSLCLKKLEEI